MKDQKRNQKEVKDQQCPNCWGKQEYGNHEIQSMRLQKLDLNNLNQTVGWISAYTTRYFDGLRKKANKIIRPCPSC